MVIVAQKTTQKNTLAFYCSSNSWGGLEMNFVRYARWFAENGHAVKVFCVEGTPVAKSAEGLEKVYVRRNRKYFDFPNAWRLKKLFRQHGVSVVWLRDARDMSTVGFTKTFSGNAFKIVYHQAMQLGVSKKDPIHTMRFRKIDAWIALLPYLAKQVETHTNFDPEKIHVVPLATKMDGLRRHLSEVEARRQMNLSGEPFVIGVLGRIAPLKGHDFLIEQLAKLRESGHNIELLFVGEPTREEGKDYVNQLKQTVASLDLDEFVHFRPFLKDVSVFFSAIDLFAMASTGETFGNVTIESMVSGVPVLGTNASGTPEILEHGNLGFLYEVNDAKSFLERVDWIVSHPEKVKETAEKAMKIARMKYDRDTVCAQLESVLKQIGYSSQSS